MRRKIHSEKYSSIKQQATYYESSFIKWEMYTLVSLFKWTCIKNDIFEQKYLHLNCTFTKLFKNRTRLRWIYLFTAIYLKIQFIKRYFTNILTLLRQKRLSIQWILTSRCEIFFLSLSQIVRADICKRIYDRKFLKDFVTALKNE